VKKILLFASLASTALFLTLASAQNVGFKTGLEVMQAQDKLPRPQTQIATLSMEINRGGTVLSRTMKQWSASGEVEKALIKFLAPADIKGSGFMSIKKANVTETFLWLPSIGRVRRLSSSDSGGSFFGSDLSNEDLSGFALKDYDFKLLESKDNQYVVESKPKGDSSYEKIVSYIDNKSLLTKKSEYYRDGGLYKVFNTTDITTMKNYAIARTLVMETPSLKSKTTLKFSEVQVDTPIADDIFTERNLKK
jgi:outer membrane lipoprotein-sorting protein